MALILMGAAGVASADLASDSGKLAQIDSLIKAFEPRFTVTQVDAETVQLWLREQRGRRGVAIDNLRGGMLLWAHAQGPMVDARMQATRRVHVYGASWDLLPRTYQSVY